MTETYAYLTKLGVDNGYCVIPEFTIPIPIDSPRKRKLDLVFAKKRPNNEFINNPPTCNLDVWEVHYAFEIEGIDVPYSRLREHIENYQHFIDEQQGIFKIGISVLYHRAYHRGHWNMLYHNNYGNMFINRMNHFNIIREYLGLQLHQAEIRISDDINEHFPFDNQLPWELYR